MLEIKLVKLSKWTRQHWMSPGKIIEEWVSSEVEGLGNSWRDASPRVVSNARLQRFSLSSSGRQFRAIRQLLSRDPRCLLGGQAGFSWRCTGRAWFEMWRGSKAINADGMNFFRRLKVVPSFWRSMWAPLYWRCTALWHAQSRGY